MLEINLISLIDSFIQSKVVFDAEGIFHAPVTKLYPEIARDYMKKVKTPLDFATIRNERLQKYRVVSDLQNDLTLVFRNCCTYHKVNTVYWEYAMYVLL
jgi:hypothetical protein